MTRVAIWLVFQKSAGGVQHRRVFGHFMIWSIKKDKEVLLILITRRRKRKEKNSVALHKAIKTSTYYINITPQKTFIHYTPLSLFELWLYQMQLLATLQQSTWPWSPVLSSTVFSVLVPSPAFLLSWYQPPWWVLS